MARQNLLKDFNKHIDELLPQLMELDFHTEDEKETILHELKDKYLNGSNEIDDSNDKRFIQVNVYSVKRYLKCSKLFSHLWSNYSFPPILLPS